MEKQNLDDSPHAKRKLHLCQHSKLCNVCKATRFPNDEERIRFLLDTHEQVKQSGKPNYLGCKIRINNRMNIDYMRSLLKNYKDKEICDLLEFGFPLGCQESDSLYTMFTKMINGNTEIIMVQMISQKICCHTWEKKVNAVLFWDLSVVTLFLQV